MDRQVWANDIDPDQTAIPSAFFGFISLWKIHISQILGYYSNFVGCPKFEEFYSIWATTWQNQQSECAPSKDSDQSGHSPSLIRVFAVCMKKAGVLSYPLSTSDDSDQTGQIWVFAGRTVPLLVLSCHGSYYTKLFKVQLSLVVMLAQILLITSHEFNFLHVYLLLSHFLDQYNWRVLKTRQQPSVKWFSDFLIVTYESTCKRNLH